MNFLKWIRPQVISRPPKPADEPLSGVKYVWLSGEWRPVCDFCGGNCGQCGITSRVGNVPASMSEMVKNLTKGAA